MEKNRESIITICPFGEGQFLKIKAAILTEAIGRYVAFEACFADSEKGDSAETPFMYLIAEYLYVPKGYGSETAYIMDSESERWGEMGFQLFGDVDRYKPRFTPGSVMMLDPEITRGAMVNNDVIFSDTFDMDTFVAALMKTAAKLHKKERPFDYFVFYGHEGRCPDDAKWCKKLKELACVTYFRMTKVYVNSIPGCFLCVWDASKTQSKPKVKCIAKGMMEWTDYAANEPD